jgi:putative transposase
MIVKAANEKPLTKTSLAKQEGLARSSLYYKPIKPSKDWHLKNQIELVLHRHPSYGHRRLALQLRVNKKRVLRVMKLYGIKPYRRRGKKYRKPKDLGTVYQNLIQAMPFPANSNIIWASDFTHISFHGRFVYLATIKDVFDRRVVGWSLLTSHAVQLTVTALIDAVEKHGRPQILHSDQGSEYKSKVYGAFAKSLGIQLSMSHKGSPWENGYQESFYSQFKVDLGDPNRFKTLGELAVAIYREIHYYNTDRIHTKLKMPPQQYAERRLLTTNLVSVKL